MKAILKKCEEFHVEGITQHEFIKAAAVTYRKYQIYEMIQLIEPQPDSDPSHNKVDTTTLSHVVSKQVYMSNI